MKTKLIISILFCMLLFNCEKEEDYDPSNLIDIMTLELVNNNAPADGVTKIDVIARFIIDFETETDNKVEFSVFKDSIETSLQDIVLSNDDSENIKTSQLSVAYNRLDSIKVRATISSAGSQIYKEQYLKFSKAYLDSINVFSDSLIIQPSSFGEIQLTTELIRNTGRPNSGTVADTKVVDTLGQERGVFNNYANHSNEAGKIINTFTLGNDDYTGKLYVISRSQGENNISKIDSLTIYSQN